MVILYIFYSANGENKMKLFHSRENNSSLSQFQRDTENVVIIQLTSCKPVLRGNSAYLSLLLEILHQVQPCSMANRQQKL